MKNRFEDRNKVLYDCATKQGLTVLINYRKIVSMMVVEGECTYRESLPIALIILKKVNKCNIKLLRKLV